jgi:hypothetical protein
MFFSLHPALLVNFPDGSTKTITDIFRRVSANKFANNFAAMQEITIPDGFTVEQVADKYYGRPDYHWIILILNEIIDVRQEWPMYDRDLIEYAKLKYGSVQIYETHHYRTTDVDKLIVDYDATELALGNIEEVTNMQYEEEMNNKKREIQVLRPEFLYEFVSLYTSLVK